MAGGEATTEAVIGGKSRRSAGGSGGDSTVARSGQNLRSEGRRVRRAVTGNGLEGGGQEKRKRQWEQAAGDGFADTQDNTTASRVAETAKGVAILRRDPSGENGGGGEGGAGKGVGANTCTPEVRVY